MEVLITIAIVGISLAPVFVMQRNALFSLRTYSLRLQEVFKISSSIREKFFIPSEANVEGEREKTSPEVTVKPVKKESALSSFKYIHTCSVTEETMLGIEETVVGFVWKPQKQEEQ